MIIIGNDETYKRIYQDILKEYELSEDIINENIARKILENVNLNKESYLIILDNNFNKKITLSIAIQLKLMNKKVYLYSKEYIQEFNNLKKLGITILNKLILTDIYLISCEIKNIILNQKIEIYNINIVNKTFKAYKTINIFNLNTECLNLNICSNLGEIVTINNLFFNENKLKKYSDIYLIEKSDIKKMKKNRKESDNKTDYGKNVIIAGSEEYPGAANLALYSSIKSGVGYTYFLNLFSNDYSILNKMPELIITKDENICEQANTLAIGPGIVKIDKINHIIKKYKDKKNIILDAGALNNKLDIYDSKNILITPHTGEFSRLTNISLEDIIKNPSYYTKKIAQEKNINILLKGKNTYISDGNKIYVINTGNPYMANAGMGDVLIGIISSLTAQKYSIIESSIIGVYLHGYIADELFKNQYIINPSDIIKNITKYLKILFF